jgi:hypothetical protein
VLRTLGALGKMLYDSKMIKSTLPSPVFPEALSLQAAP